MTPLRCWASHARAMSSGLRPSIRYYVILPLNLTSHSPSSPCNAEGEKLTTLRKQHRGLMTNIMYWLYSFEFGKPMKLDIWGPTKRPRIEPGPGCWKTTVSAQKQSTISSVCLRADFTLDHRFYAILLVIRGMLRGSIYPDAARNTASIVTLTRAKITWKR